MSSHDGHAEPPDPAGWGDHRVQYVVRKSVEWKRWELRNQQWMDQASFAEHIEEAMLEIVEPPAADMLDLAQTLQATTSVAFRSQQLLANGQRQFKYEETIDATAGAAGELKIPSRFVLGVRLYDGIDDPYKIAARLQFRIRDRKLSLRYLLDRPLDHLRSAFGDVTAVVEAGTGIGAYRGQPASPLS